MAGTKAPQPSASPKRKRKIQEDVESGGIPKKPADSERKKPKVNALKEAPGKSMKIRSDMKQKTNAVSKAAPGKFTKGKSDRNPKANAETMPVPGKFKKGTSDMKAEKPLDRKARKELAEFRKKKRRPNYDLEKEIKLLWEKMRKRDLEKVERTALVSKTLEKMKGKLVEMGSSHISSRVVQSCVKHCKQSERDAVFAELRPHTLTLARNTYAYHLVIKMLDHANKSQLQQMMSILHGNVVALLRHPVGSAVVEHAYGLANGTQKRELVCEFYSPEYRLFKGVTTGGGISELMASQPISKQNTMLEHMMLSLQPILEKGIVDHSITHRALVEYLSVCKKSMLEEVVKSLAGPLLVRMIHTKDGAKVGVICVKYSTAKERKSIIKGMKGHASKIAQGEHSSIVLLAILENVDDTKLISKIIINEIMKDLKDMASDKSGRRWLLHLLAPGVARYFPAYVLAVLQHSITPNLQDRTSKSSTEVNTVDTVLPSAQELKKSEDVDDGEVEENALEAESDEDTGKVRGISKKDPSVRRFELLSTGGLGKKLAEMCTENANELLQSPVGADLIYEVCLGGLDEVMWQVASEGVLCLHRAIADLAAKPPVPAQTTETEHVLEQYHASRTIRRLILNSKSPTKCADAQSFAATLWETALKSKCKLWAKGHSAKVVSAYKICGDSSAKEVADREVQGLIDAGLLEQNEGGTQGTV